MKKNYKIVKDGVIEASCYDVELAADFEAAQLADGYEYMEISELVAPEDFEHIELVSGVLALNAARKLEKETEKQERKDRKGRLDLIDLTRPIPPADLDEVLRDFIKEMRG